MDADRPRYGPLVAAVGAIVLAIAVFLPWYGVSLTTGGVALAQQASDQVAAQFGNAALQSYMSGVHAGIGALAGHELGTLSAHDALTNISVVLLILAGLAILLGLGRLAGAQPASYGDGGPFVLLGALAAACVLFRMVVRPAFDGELASLSLHAGAWLALAGAAAMILGGLWPRAGGSSRPSSAKPSSTKPSSAKLEDVWSELSGWTPGS
jgi:hypothetical protein